MQKLQIFAIFDKKAVAYLNPFYCHQKGQAIRHFEDATNDPQTPFNKHPEDYSLFHLGEFDDASGKISPLQNPQHIEEALNLKKESK